MTATLANPAPAARMRLGGLDGLRAIAVSLVLIYHLWPEALPGGFLGVDIFFVISGFLITSLLLDEHRRRGRLALGSFWRRRARRLLPALGLVLLVCTSAAWLVDAELLVNIGAQVFGAAFFVANWVYVALGADYFARDNPELFRNTWSLAIEEQFYLLLPLVLLLALRMGGRASRALLFGTAAVCSALWMATLAAEGAPATRIYFGTDSHVFGLLFGVTLACAMRPRGIGAQATNHPAQLTLSKQLALLALGAAGLTLLGYLALTLQEGGPASFAWGFQLASAAALAVIWAATREASWLGMALDVQPLRWIGDRSYGIYLWHWPVLLLVDAMARKTGIASWSVPLLALALTLLFAALSFRYVEQPVRVFGLRRSLAGLAHPLRLRGRQLVVGIAVLAILFTALPTTGIAIATAPTQSSSAEAITRGQAALEAMNAARVQQVSPDSSVPKSAENETDESDPDAFNPNWLSTPGSEPLEVAAPEPVQGWEIFAVGDSVMLASVPELGAVLPDIWIDADVSRGLSYGVDIVTGLEATGQLRPVLVVGLGTNGPISEEDLTRLLRVAGERRIVLVNAFGDRWWIPEVNQQLRTFADAHRGVTLADWEAVIPTVPGGLAGDEIHPNPVGGEAYAAAVQSALEALLHKDEQPERRRK